MITEKDVDQFHEAKRKLSVLESRIIDRVDELIKLGAKICGYERKIDYWYFDDAQENEMGTLVVDEDGVGNITIDIYCGKPGYNEYIEWFSAGFDLEDLYMSDEEFEDKYVKLMKEAKEKKEAKKEKARAYNAKKKKVDDLLEVERKRLMKEE